MHVDLTPEQKDLQSELRDYFTTLMTDDMKASIRNDELGPNEPYRGLIRTIGADGWLGVNWPEEYGGKGYTAVENYIFFNEAQKAGCPIPFLTTNTVGPTLRHFGTEEQKNEFLPKILAGDVMFSIGYSEPGAGSDLASLQTKAVKDGDEWVINGQKLYTSLAWDADYVWLAARTDPEAKAHKGITIFLVPTDDPGFSITPFITMGTTNTTATFYDDVRVPESAVVGEVNGGWGLITNQLNAERVSLCAAGGITNTVDQIIDWARETEHPDGGRVIDQEWVQVKLAEMRARVRFLDLLNWKVAFNQQNGELNPGVASSVKVWGSESMHAIYKEATELFGALGALRPGSPGAILAGRIDEVYRGVWVLTFGGGTNELQRDIIGWAGLGLPRAAAQVGRGAEEPTMDFNLNETEQAISDLAHQILGDKIDHERLKEIEASDEWFAADEWNLLAEAGLVGIALPEAHGGGGLGIIEAGLVCEAVGRHVAPVPMLPTIVAAMTIAEFGSDELQADVLPGVAAGTTVLTLAVSEHLREDLTSPGTTATAEGDIWRLDGTKVVVEFCDRAAHAVVTAATPDGPALFLVDPNGEGTSSMAGVTSRKETVHELTLERAPATLLASGHDAVRWLEARDLALVCATQLGVVEGQLRMTADYTTERQQFGRPIATFQAVTQRLADCFIQVEGLRLQTQSALWRLANGVDAWEDLRIAKWFGSEGAHFVAHGAQHMHGGIGVDVDYPLHRYTLWNRHLEVTLGASSRQLRALGAQLAES